MRLVFWEVDAQVDFMLPGGKLYVPGAEKIIPNLNRLVAEVRPGRVLLISSADAHQPDDPDFLVFGVVTEYCVRCAADGLLRRGHRVSIVKDAIQSLDEKNGREVLDQLQSRGARLITTEEALASVDSSRQGLTNSKLKKTAGG